MSFDGIGLEVITFRNEMGDSVIAVAKRQEDDPSVWGVVEKFPTVKQAKQYVAQKNRLARELLK